MSVQLYNGWYVATPYSDIGRSSGESSQYQIYNAEKIYNIFIAEGWTVNAISAMIGNMNYESNLNPARVYHVGGFPHQGASLSDIGNDQAIHHPDEAYGLVQWKGRGEVDPDNNQLVGYAIRYNTEWYDGDIQIQRLLWEYHDNKKFHPQTIDGVYWTWDKFVSSTETPEKLAIIWMKCYEGTDSVRNVRRENARKWYDYFTGSPGPEPPTPPEPPEPPPEPDPPDEDWVMGEDLAYWADHDINPESTGIPIPYSQMNDAEFVSEAWGYVPVVNDNQWYLENNAEAIWTSQSTYPTDEPLNERPPCPQIWYKETIADHITNYGTLPVGALIFKRSNNTMVQVGIYMGNGMMMTSDQAHGVHKGRFIESYWTHFGFICWVMPVEFKPGPVEPLTPVEILTLWYNSKRKDVRKNVKRSF